jgi:hypothetical protein
MKLTYLLNSLCCSLYSLLWSLPSSLAHPPASAARCTPSTDHCQAHLVIEYQPLLLSVILYWSLLGSPIHCPASASHCSASTDHWLAHLLIVQHLLLAVHPPLITAKLTCSLSASADHCTVGGFNFILFWNFNRTQTENDRYWQKNNFLLYAKCLNMSIKTMQNFMLIFQIRWYRLSEMPAPNKS